MLAVSAGKPFFRLVVDNVEQTTAPFALMASAALMLVVLWQRSPALSVALVGPLLAIALYQRSTFKAIRAMRLALTDPLTGSAITATSTSGSRSSSPRPSKRS